MDEQERARLRAAIEATEGGAPDPAAVDALVRRMLTESRTIAIVGASPRPDRPSHGVLRTLAAAGWRILPINPMPEALRDGVAGLTCFPTLRAAAASLPAGEQIDLVDVFRRSEECEEVAREAVAIGARGLWLQLGIISPAAAQIAAEAGIDFVQDRCPAIELPRLGISGPNSGASA
ncbi:MAG: CoA-binding protein [Candidatus Aquidulcis sp.]|nr:MAG: CoA-binding protein [Candidatus Aquidulcis sp.]